MRSTAASDASLDMARFQIEYVDNDINSMIAPRLRFEGELIVFPIGVEKWLSQQCLTEMHKVRPE
jgi:hypothetical protein